MTPEVQWLSRRCIACKTCVATCPARAVVYDERGVFVDSARCELSLQCVRDCPANALTLLGKRYTAEELVREALKDEMFFGEFKGGVTASGGEPLLQYEFVAEFFRLLKEKGVNTALDTSGCVPPEAMEAVLPYTDVVLYDLKFIDPDLHRLHTGADNALILSNFERLIAETKRKPTDKTSENKIKQNKTKLWVRTPLIPGSTATVENIVAIGEYINRCAVGSADVVERWELCTFNNVSRDKYQRMRLDWQYASQSLMFQSEVEKFAAIAREYLHDKVCVSGLTAK
jgi:pyruvate formate lyase activating enzyme